MSVRVPGRHHNEVATSATGSASEFVALTDPDPGPYDVYIDLFGGPDQTVKQPTWVLDSDGSTTAGATTLVWVNA